MSLLPVEPAHRLASRPAQQRWLVTDLWAEQAVGILGGEPKTCKSFMALELAVAVAAGTPCLRRFAVSRPGRVLVYAAEDAPAVVRQRLDGICATAGVALRDLDIQVITAPTLRLDLSADRNSLTHTVAALTPRLLILDPFVRLHRVDENSSGEIAPLLAYLRELQRRYQLAVVVVHHARKAAHRLRDGQALRGSSEFHAWGDCNLYLRRRDDSLTLTVEHRAAPPPAPIPLVLRADDDAVALAVSDRPPPLTGASPPLDERIVTALADACSGSLSVAALRSRCRVRNATLYRRLAALCRQGVLVKSAAGYRLADQPDASVPVPSTSPGNGTRNSTD